MDASINPKALWDISYGLYGVASAVDGRLNGQIVNTIFQVTGDPPRVAVSLNKLNLTHEYVAQSGVLAVTTLEEQVSMNLIGLFGFKSGREVDKLAQADYTLGANGCPIVGEGALSVMEGRVVGSVDAGTHTVFIVELTRAEVLKQGSPLTYAYYQTVKKGHASKNAPTFKGVPEPPQAAPAGRYECPTCGYEYNPADGDPDADIAPGTAFADLPDDWCCPICGAAKAEFTAVG